MGGIGDQNHHELATKIIAKGCFSSAF